MTKLPSINYNWLYELTHTNTHTCKHTHRQTQWHCCLNILRCGVFLSLCVCVRHRLDRCLMPVRQTGIVGWHHVLVWVAGHRQRSLHGLCPQRRAGRQRLNGSPLGAELRGCVWEGLREVKDTHTYTHTRSCEMRDLTSTSGSDIGGHTVPRTVYAGKTH